MACQCKKANANCDSFESSLVLPKTERFCKIQLKEIIGLGLEKTLGLPYWTWVTKSSAIRLFKKYVLDDSGYIEKAYKRKQYWK